MVKQWRNPTALVGCPPEHRDWDGESFFHPVVAASCRISAFVTIDGGLTRPTSVGERVFCMAHTHIGHDAVVGDDCELAPGTVIGGHAELGRGVRCGVNVSVKPFVKVGDGARLGMGAVVLRDVPAGEVWAGNPARRIREHREDRWLTESEAEGWEMVAEHERGRGRPTSSEDVAVVVRVTVVGVVQGQCCACGREESAEWSITVVRDRSSDMRAYFRLCEACYRSAMSHLETRPEVTPLRGYR